MSCPCAGWHTGHGAPQIAGYKPALRALKAETQDADGSIVAMVGAGGPVITRCQRAASLPPPQAHTKP